MAIKVGIFVDSENVRVNGGYHLRYDILRRFAERGERTLLRLNCYMALDMQRAEKDSDYARKCYNQQQIARQFGWKVTVREMRDCGGENNRGGCSGASNLAIAVDALQQAEHLDEILLVSGDDDFLPLVGALQGRGRRVELLGFDHVSPSLQRQVDTFHSGFLIPNLIPIAYEPKNSWGRTGSCVRGICSKWFVDKGYGFLNFLERIDDNSWITNTRLKESPWNSAFCHINEIATDITEEDLVHGDTVLEFYIQESPQDADGLVAQNVRLVQA